MRSRSLVLLKDYAGSAVMLTNFIPGSSQELGAVTDSGEGFVSAVEVANDVGFPIHGSVVKIGWI